MRSSVIMVPLLPAPRGSVHAGVPDRMPSGATESNSRGGPGTGRGRLTTRRQRIRRSERVDLGLQSVRVDLHLLLDDVLPVLDRGLDAPFDVGRGDHDEPAGAGIEQLAEVLEV